MDRITLLCLGLLAAALGGGCGKPMTDSDRALLDVKSYIDANLTTLHEAVVALQAAAPAADDDGWNATADAAAVRDMETQWKRARTAYEQIEGAIATLFPELDVSTDARYDGFVATAADDNLFDDQGVTGIHAIERIVWSDRTPPRVVTFESGLPGYKAAAFPQTRAEADDFKNKLCARLVADVQTIIAQFSPLALDAAAAYRGVIGSMGEQVEKANKASTFEEESRYAQYTLADMRANVSAGLQTFSYFEPWLRDKGGSDLATQIRAGFDRVDAMYASLPGDALPEVPLTWSATPSQADLATPFGQLFALLSRESDPEQDGSLVHAMNLSADVLGIPQLR